MYKNNTFEVNNVKYKIDLSSKYPRLIEEKQEKFQKIKKVSVEIG